MGFWSSLGKIGLAAAPYIAAPFTGGASLSFAPMTNQALGAWNQKDANNRAAQGLGPSSFDKFLGLGSGVAGMANSFGAFNGLGGGIRGDINRVANKVQGPSGWQSGLNQIGQGLSRGMTQPQQPFGGPQQQQQPSLNNNVGLPPYAMNFGGGQQGGMNQYGSLQRDMRQGLGPLMGSSNQNNPNLALAIGQGRLEAMGNQPFRKGYEINYLGSDDETPFKTQMPAINTYGARGSRRGRRGGDRNKPTEEKREE